MKKHAAAQRPEKTPEQRRAALLNFIQNHGWGVLLGVLLAVAAGLLLAVILGAPKHSEPSEENRIHNPRYETAYIASLSPSVPYYDGQGQSIGSVCRGTKLTYTAEEPLELNGETCYLAYFESLQYGYVAASDLVSDPADVVRETSVYVRTPQNLRPTPEDTRLGTLVEQGTQLQVLGYDTLTDGVVDYYRVRSGEDIGYIKGSYVTSSLEEATAVFDRFGIYMAHSGRKDLYGGGDAVSLDYDPREKPVFSDNTMPNPCYSLYLTCDPDVIDHIDDYIAYAKTTKINAFVLNIMDGTSVAYPAEAMKKYSPSAAKLVCNSVESFREAVQKVRAAGFYAIGRLTVFNDDYLAVDHPEYAITDAQGEPLYLGGGYWPSAYCRYVWEYKVALAKEAVEVMGFQEIQFDYVRFPDGTYSYEKDENINYHNEYGETKAQAVQRFLMYACDELHPMGVYVGADVFGETSGSYVTSYGQYWPAISNVVDVISGMPYPDHFTQDGSYRPWEHPYDTLLGWAKNAARRQEETTTPAVARTWIQAYDAIRYPYNTYGPEEIAAQLQALQEAGLSGGFMAWNSTCELEKLESFKPSFDALP